MVTKEDAFRRLEAEEEKASSENAEAGKCAGLTWAREAAGIHQLRRLERHEPDAGDWLCEVEKWRETGPRSIADSLFSVITGRSTGYQQRDVAEFWESAIGRSGRN